jgi:hypothetical protein
MARGFYSVVQYCPDRFRAEAVNVGLVLLCEDPHSVRVRMAGSHARVKKLFAADDLELKNLKLAAQGLQSGIENGSADFRTAADLAAFAASRANDLRLTEPRLAKLENVAEDFERLFAKLVEAQTTATRAEAHPAEVLPPKLSEVFYQLQQAQKIWRPGTITVPVFNRKIEIPYAYKNGVVNLVKPHSFHGAKRMEHDAATLAVNGDLLRKHPMDGEEQRLIVVSTHETPEQAREIKRHVEPLFVEYGVRLVRPADADDFAREVELSAH